MWTATRGQRPRACTETPCSRTERSCVRLRLMESQAASGSPRTHAGDERAQEVAQFRSTEEVSEQGWPRGGGGGDGGKGTGQGEHAPAKRVSDTAPKRRV